MRRIRCVAVGLCLSLVALAGPGAAADPLRVHDAAGLAAALETATGGLILLDPGSYGDLLLRRPVAAPVTLQAARPHEAVFAKIHITGGGNLLFDGITVNEFRAERGSADIGLINAQVRELVYMRNVRGLRIEGNDIRGKRFGVILNTVQDFVLRDNLIHDAVEDLLRITGNSHDGLVEGNRLHDMRSTDDRATGGGAVHSDAIQMFGFEGVTPHDIVIRRNHIWDDPATGAPTTTPQGIFVTDPQPDGYRNILIEENLIAVRSPNSIAISDGRENVMVRNNTLIAGLEGDGGAVIRLGGRANGKVGPGLNAGTTVTGNVMKLLRDETGTSTIGTNYIYGRKAPLLRLFSGPGSRWQDFVPRPGARFALGSGLGADAYLSDLLAGR